MRIVIDMQGAQCASRYRGLGRFTLQFAKAFACLAQPRHEVLFALNGSFDDSIEWLEREFDGLLSRANFRIFRPVSPCCALDEINVWRRQASELIYRQFIDTLQPDLLMITSLFEGQADDAVSTIDPSDREYGVTLILHDLIPLLDPETHLTTTLQRNWYYRALDALTHVDFLGSSSFQVGNLRSSLPRIR